MARGRRSRPRLCVSFFLSRRVFFLFPRRLVVRHPALFYSGVAAVCFGRPSALDAEHVFLSPFQRLERARLHFRPGSAVFTAFAPFAVTRCSGLHAFLPPVPVGVYTQAALSSRCGVARDHSLALAPPPSCVWRGLPHPTSGVLCAVQRQREAHTAAHHSDHPQSVLMAAAADARAHSFHHATAPPAPRIPTTRPRHVHDTPTTRPRHVRDTSTTRPRHVRDTSSIRPQGRGRRLAPAVGEHRPALGL